MTWANLQAAAETFIQEHWLSSVIAAAGTIGGVIAGGVAAAVRWGVRHLAAAMDGFRLDVKAFREELSRADSKRLEHERKDDERFLAAAEERAKMSIDMVQRLATHHDEVMGAIDRHADKVAGPLGHVQNDFAEIRGEFRSLREDIQTIKQQTNRRESPRIPVVD